MDATGFTHQPSLIGTMARTTRRNYALSVILLAIQEYGSKDDAIHQDAASFLYPQDQDDQFDFSMLVEIAGQNEQWLRESLDRCRRQWDLGRARRKAKEANRGIS